MTAPAPPTTLATEARGALQSARGHSALACACVRDCRDVDPVSLTTHLCSSAGGFGGKDRAGGSHESVDYEKELSTFQSFLQKGTPPRLRAHNSFV